MAKISKSLRKYSVAAVLFAILIVLLWIIKNDKGKSGFQVNEVEYGKEYIVTAEGTASFLDIAVENQVAFFSGFAVAKSMENGEKRRITWVLKSSFATYEIPCEVTGVDYALAISSVSNERNGFRCEIDFSQIRDGEYESFIWIEESEQESAWIDMDIRFSKNSDKIEIITAEKADNVAKSAEYGLQFSLGVGLDIKIADSYFLVRGCAYIPEKESSLTKYFLEITDASGKQETYQMNVRKSLWAKETLGSQYEYFDISAFLKKDEMPQTDVIIRIYAENQGDYFTCSEIRYLYHGGAYILAD